MHHKITSSDFVHTFHGIWKSVNRRFCFILGAGASKSSGIKTGGELAKEWLDEIKSRLNDRDGDFDKFIKERGIDSANPGTHYSAIYEECFGIDPSSGFEYINREMENARPGYGYSVLAQILASKHHNVVITTNFDSLTEEALYTYTSKRPLICGHESLAAFAKPSIDRPLIIKIHRDRFLDPQSRSEEVNAVNEVWAEALDPILRNCIPVFIGYGGNDGSLMGYLDKVLKYENIFWCERVGASISNRVKGFLDRHNGKLVEIEGFDELMFLLQAKLELPLLNSEIIDIANKRAEKYRSTFEKIRDSRIKSPEKEVQEAAEKIASAADDNDWWSWQIKAIAAKSAEEKENIYKKALFVLPNNGDLYGCYASFLNNEKKDYNDAEYHFKMAFELGCDHFMHYNNYANFLCDIRENYNEAEKYYKLAIENAPNEAILYNNYAILLTTLEKYDDADRQYKMAIELDHDNGDLIGNYARFLQRTLKDYNEADRYYKNAIKSDVNNANNNANYAGFLLARGDKNLYAPYLEKAFKFYNHSSILLEAYFYTYAHVVADRENALVKIKELLCEGIRSINFDLQPNIDRAIQDGHPDPVMLQRLADIITKDAPLGDLCDGIKKEYPPDPHNKTTTPQ